MHSLTPGAIVWVSMLAASILMSLAMTTLVLGASYTVPTAPAVAQTCDTTSNWQLIYAQTTGRVPTSYCPASG
jgi:multidrug transporter EmrE-like cation transporter